MHKETLLPKAVLLHFRETRLCRDAVNIIVGLDLQIQFRQNLSPLPTHEEYFAGYPAWAAKIIDRSDPMVVAQLNQIIALINAHIEEGGNDVNYLRFLCNAALQIINTPSNS